MITVEQIMNHNSCRYYPEPRVRDIIGNGMTIEEYLDLDESLFDSIKDKYWVLSRCDFLTEKQLHLIAVRAAEIVLPIFEKRYPSDKRPREAINAKKKWINGEIKDNELISAAAAAKAAAADSVGCASYAAYSAVEVSYAAYAEVDNHYAVYSSGYAAYYSALYAAACYAAAVYDVAEIYRKLFEYIREII